MKDVEKKTSNEKPDAPRLQFIMSWVIVGIMTVFGTYVLVQLATIEVSEQDFWTALLREQFPVVIGLPMAAMASLFITLVLKISTGPLEFEFMTFKFKGGAAPIVFWVICFLAFTIAINLLWQQAPLSENETTGSVLQAYPVDS